jgi:hypothetical protein
MKSLFYINQSNGALKTSEVYLYCMIMPRNLRNHCQFEGVTFLTLSSLSQLTLLSGSNLERANIKLIAGRCHVTAATNCIHGI